MLRLLDRGMVPPGGFRFLNRETHHWVRAPSFRELIVAVTEHRKANNNPITQDIEALIEDQLCSLMPPGVCLQDGGTQPKHVRLLSLQEVKTATLTLGEWLLTGKPKVAQEEADKRSGICSACPYNQKVANCVACSLEELRQLVVSIVGTDKTINDKHLETCFICGCSLKAAVWLPIELLQKHSPPEQMANAPDWCWKKRL